MSIGSELTDFLGKGVILVIEPVSNYRISIKNFLSNLKIKNYRIVGSVAEARREMLTVKVRIFVCEWQLPEKNGLIFCRELRREKANRDSPFLLLSTESLRKDVILASEGGVDAYLLKPFSFEDFSTQLSSLIAAAKNPSPFLSMIERAEEHIEQNETWVAEALLKEALQLKPNSARAMAGIGRIHLANGDQMQALVAFRSAVEVNPEYIDGHKYLLKIAEQTRDLQGMLRTARTLHSLSPENPRYPLMMARALMELGNLNASEEMFRVCVRLSPTLADAFRGLGVVHMHRKEFEKAVKSFEKALDLEKGDIPTLNSLGMSYVKQGLFEDGIQRYKMALKINPNDARVLFNLGLAWTEFGQVQNARDAFQRAIAADPKLEKAKRQLFKLNKNRTINTTDGDAKEIPIIPSFKKGA